MPNTNTVNTPNTKKGDSVTEWASGGAVGFLNEPDVHNIGQFGQNRQPFLERFDDFAKSSSKNTSKLFNCNK